MPSFMESGVRQQRRLRPSNTSMAVLIPFTYDSLRRCLEGLGGGERPGSRPLLLDCRPRSAHREGHIVGAFSVHCSRRRTTGGLRALLPEAPPGVREGLAEGAWQAVVLYEDHGLSSLEDSAATFVARCLQAEAAVQHIYLLEGGYQRFRHHCPHLCTVSSPSEADFTSPGGLRHAASTPTASSNPRASGPSPRVGRCNSCSGPLSSSPPSCADQEVPVEILPHLYLGSAHHASSKEVLQRLGITALLNVSHTCPNHFEDSFTYKSIPVEDSGNEDISVWFHEAIDYIERVKSSNGKVLVHCEAGISRSATICMAYLMASKLLRMEDAYEYVKSRRKIISPNFNFMGQLLSFEAQVFATGNVGCLKMAPSPKSPIVAILTSSSPRSPLLAVVANPSPDTDSSTPACSAKHHNVFNFTLAEEDPTDHMSLDVSGSLLIATSVEQATIPNVTC